MRGRYDFNNNVRLTGEFKWHTETFFVGQPTYDFNQIMSVDNPFMPASIRDAAVTPGGIVASGGTALHVPGQFRSRHA